MTRVFWLQKIKLYTGKTRGGGGASFLALAPVAVDISFFLWPGLLIDGEAFTLL